MSGFSDLLRGSRLSQVPLKKNVKLINNPKKRFPIHQIITTKPNTMREFKEWGLKAAIPSVSSKTKYMVVNELDNKYRMTEFEPISGGFNWNRLRLQELNIAPNYVQKKNPLFFKNTPAPISLRSLLDSKSKKTYLQSDLFRSEFKAWLVEKYPNSLYRRGFNHKNLETETLEFLNIKFARDEMSMTKSIVGCGGLSYNLKGRISNTPNGLVMNPIVPGRILNGPSTSERLVSVAGFAALCSNNEKFINKEKSMGKGVFRENRVPVQVQQYNVTNDGDLPKTEMIVKVIDDVNQNSGSLGGNKKKFINLGAPRSKPSSAYVNDMKQSQLEVMEFLSSMMMKKTNNSKEDDK